MLKHILLVIALFVPATSFAAQPDDCAGTPPDAVMALPAPLSTWGKIVCTPQGHVIASREGFVWTRPGGFVPMFIPSQVVHADPQPVGNKSYFTRIAFTELPPTDPEAAAALDVLYKGVALEPVSRTFRLDVAGSLGGSLKLYFFNVGTSTWGIWCVEVCQQKSRFMVLDMRKALKK